MGSSSVVLRAAWVVDPPEPDADDPAVALARFGERLADAVEGTAAEGAPATPVVLEGADSGAALLGGAASGRTASSSRGFPAGRPHRDRRGGGIQHLVTAPRSPLAPTPPTRTRKVPMAVILSVSGSPSPARRTWAHIAGPVPWHRSRIAVTCGCRVRVAGPVSSNRRSTRGSTGTRVGRRAACSRPGREDRDAEAGLDHAEPPAQCTDALGGPVSVRQPSMR